jgi:peptidoglycan/xylan/chitin deacetylase (PgdA/CDA1 family)
MADRITDYHQTFFTNTNLSRAYSNLLRVLDNKNLKATFAFVGAFTMSADEYYEQRELFGDSHAARIWLKRFVQDVNSGVYDGWFTPQLLQAVIADGRHEIASHGFSHLSFNEAMTSVEDAEHELQAMTSISRQKGFTPKTFVYPRNDIGYRHLLQAFGYVGFRDYLQAPRWASGRVGSLAREFNLFQTSQPHSAREPLISLPPGYFLNWRFGMRQAVPLAITSKRWQSIIDDAVRRRTVAHMWLHPHNLIDGNRQVYLLDRILHYVSQKIHNDEMINCTQVEYTSAVIHTTIPSSEPCRSFS